MNPAALRASSTSTRTRFISTGESGQPRGSPGSVVPRIFPLPTVRPSNCSTTSVMSVSCTAWVKRSNAISGEREGKQSSTSVRSTHLSPASRASTTACTASATPNPGRYPNADAPSNGSMREVVVASIARATMRSCTAGMCRVRSFPFVSMSTSVNWYGL